MSEPVRNRSNNPESYRPKNKPEILNMAEGFSLNNADEVFVERVNENCSIVDRAETTLVGIAVELNFESQGYPGKDGLYLDTANDAFVSRKYIEDGTVDFLAESLGINLDESGIISARYNIQGDGNYSLIVGFPFESFDELPEFLPENSATLTLPACRYAKIEINERKKESRAGYDERMHADEYFISGFRSDTEYIYSEGGYPMNAWDKTGDILTKYEPVRLPTDENDKFDTFAFKPVLLPKWKIACCTEIHGEDEGSCISKWFDVLPEVNKTGLARYNQNGDFYGFPVDWENSYKACFGSRVSAFEGLPAGVESVTLPGGLYVHITQKEFNGDNPSMTYDVAFNHMDRLYFSNHPEYEFDDSRKVIARFRQSNCGSVFVPVKLKNGG